MTISFQTATSAQSTVGQGPLDLSNIVLAPNAETFSLNNGMEVVVIPDRRAPIVTHMVWYRVGSADEPPGKSGIAHYLEHLMFKGTEENPGSTFTGAVSRVGGRDNAFTSSDYTAYFQQVSKEHLPAMMAFEADRMNNLVLNEEVSAPELNVVLEERRSRVETRPASELGEAIDAALFVNHPYGDPIIGWPEEVAALTFQDALDFYEVHYRPENAVLVVAGDVTPEDIKTIAEQTYGKVPPGGGKIERTRPPIQKLRADRVVTLTDQRVRQPSTQVSWIVPSYTTAEPGVAEALDVLAEIMGGTNTSRLYTAMVREDPVAASAGAYYQSSAIDDTRFVLYASPRGDVALETLEERARAILADIAEKGVTDDEVRRAKTTVLSGVVFAQDSQSSMARIFGASLTTGATVEDVQNWPSRISAVTADDVQNVASTLLHGRASVTGRLLPQKGS
ncbi:MAG: pitrilysin family protein [Pseudomonadota bacterium]